MDLTEPSGPSFLKVTGSAVAQFLELSTSAVRVAALAQLIPEVDGWHDAEQVLALSRRGYVDPEQLRELPARSVLLLQQTFAQPDLNQPSWRTAWGWSTQLSAEQALLSACGWWPVPPGDRPHLLGVVSTVSSFVVTVAVVNRRRPVAAIHPDGRVRLNVTPATRRTPVGAALLEVFAGRRTRTFRGSSRLVP